MAAVIEYLEKKKSGSKWTLVEEVPVNMVVSRERHHAWVFRRRPDGTV